MVDPRYYVQSSQVRGERRAYWIEERDEKHGIRYGRRCIEDFGTNKRKAEKRCAELNQQQRKET
jgi:hypothetical protein